MAQEKSKDEIEMWVNALNGQLDENTPEHIAKEARLIKSLITTNVTNKLKPATDFEVKLFLKRLQHEGLIKKTASFKQYFAMAASIATLGLGLLILKPLWMPTEQMPADIVWRGEEQGQIIKHADFVEKANLIESLLKQNGLMVRRIYNAKYVRLQAKIPSDATSLKQALKTQGVEVPEHGRLDLIILAK